MNVTPIFTSVIAHDYLDFSTDELKEFCYFEKLKSPGKEVSNYGGWQSNNYQFDQPELGILSKKITEKLTDLLPNLGIKTKFEVTNCWFNINGEHDFNLPHVHGFSTLAGIFYISAPANSGKLILRNPIAGHGFCIDGSFVENWNEFNSSTWEIEPEVNKLVIWPAWIDHYTLPNQSKNDRISLAFNISICRQE